MTPDPLKGLIEVGLEAAVLVREGSLNILEVVELELVLGRWYWRVVVVEECELDVVSGARGILGGVDD